MMKALIFIVFVLFSFVSPAQRLKLNAVHIVGYDFVVVTDRSGDTLHTDFTIDSLGYMQGPFVQYRANGNITVKGAFRNSMLVDSCFWYDKEGKTFAKGNFVYKDDYSRTVGRNLFSFEKNYYAYLNDTLFIYNHADNYPTPSIVIYKNNLKHGVFHVHSKEGFENIFTYKQDTLNGYFRNTFHSKQKTFFETGNYYNGANSYDGWYYKYQLNYPDSLLLEKTWYVKNMKQESHTYYESGKPACSYYYSKPGVLDSVHCRHETGTTKSFIQYDPYGKGIEYVYEKTGQLIEKYSYMNWRREGNAYEYDALNHIRAKIVYRNDTVITKESFFDNNVVWQRIFYKNNEAEKIDWFDTKGRYIQTTTESNAKNAYWGPDGNANISTSQGSDGGTHAGFTQSFKQTQYQPYSPEKNADVIVYKPLPANYQSDAKYYFNCTDALVVSKMNNSFRGGDDFYKNLLYSMQDSLTAYSKTKNGEPLSKLKVPLNIVVSLSLSMEDSRNGFVVVHLKSINDGVNKKIKQSLELFFANRTISYTYPFHINEYFEYSYTIFSK